MSIIFLLEGCFGETYEPAGLFTELETAKSFANKALKAFDLVEIWKYNTVPGAQAKPMGMIFKSVNDKRWHGKFQNA